MRASKDDVWMAIAEQVARRGTCPRLNVGAVVVDADDYILATGYNGAPRGEAHCEIEGCDLQPLTAGGANCVRAVHAEVNALLRSGRDAKGGTLYCTHMPCVRCWSVIQNTKIYRVVYKTGYGNVSIPSNIKVDQYES